MKQSKRLFPYFLMLGLGFITLLILNAGYKMLEDQEIRKRETEKSDEAQQILGTLAKGYEFEFHLSQAVRKLKTRLRKALVTDKAAASFKIENLLWAPENFPAHDLWVFANNNQSFKTIAAPKNISISRRGIAKAFNILARNKIQKTDDKILDYFFGPGQKVKYMVLRKGLPTRVIYKKAPHLMLWDSIKTGNETAGGFFVLVPFSQELSQYAMQATADKLKPAAKTEINSNSGQHFAGYIRIFNDTGSSVFPEEMLNYSEFNDFFAQWEKPARLVELETRPLPWAQKIGKNWQLYVKVIPDSSYLAFTTLKSHTIRAFGQRFLLFLNFLFIVLLFFILAGYFKMISLPAIDLKTRFTLLFLGLTIIPFSLFLLTTWLYLEEIRTTRYKEARHELTNAISSFDRNVDKIYLDYRKKLHKLRQKNWLLRDKFSKYYKNQPLTELAADYLNNLEPPLPWAAIFLINNDGEMISKFASAEHELILDGVVQFSRVGVMEAMRLNNDLPSIAKDAGSQFISDADIALKNAYETEVKLPVYHGFTNRIIGNTTKLALDESSIVRYIDYFPEATKPVTGLCVIWAEKDLDAIFCLQTIKNVRKFHPGFEFNIFKKTNAGVRKIAQSTKNSDLSREAEIAANRDSLYFSRPDKQTLRVAIPSRRRPQLILTGAMNTDHIEEEIAGMSRDYIIYSLLGFFAVFFFLKLLHHRLISPVKTLISSLDELNKGNYTSLHTDERQDEFHNIYGTYNKMIDGLKVRQRLLSLTSDSAIERLRQTGSRQITQSLESSKAVCLVSDIRNFTTLCENYDPHIITNLLNLHFERMSKIIYSHQGEIIRFVGDAIEARFICTAESRLQVFKAATKAALAMMATLKLINQERARQQLFTYKIGIGISYGATSSFSAGEKYGRAELLQIGEPLEKAEELEALSKKYQEFPVLLDEVIGSSLLTEPDNHFDLYKPESGANDFYLFKEVPAAATYLERPLEQQEETQENRAEEILVKKGFWDFLLEKFNQPLLVFILGLLILMFPAFYSINNLYAVHATDRKNQRTTARTKNQFVLETEKLPQARKELLEIQLRKKLALMANESEESFSPSAFTSLKEKVAKELQPFGIEARQIVFSTFKEAVAEKKFPDDFPGDSPRKNLKLILNELLRLNDCQHNLFYKVNAKAMSYLGQAINISFLLKDARSRFINATVASETHWFYWQPIYNTRAQRAKESASTQFKRYGHFSAAEKKEHILGGVLLLCSPPENGLQANTSLTDENAFFASIDIEKTKVIESSHNLNELLRSIKQSSDDAAQSNAEKLIAIAHQQHLMDSNWVFDYEIIQDDQAKLNIAGTRLQNTSFAERPFLLAGVIIFIIYAFLATFLWFSGFYRQKFLAKSVKGQVMGSFLGLMVFPVIGVFVTLTLLMSGWQTNILQIVNQDFINKSSKFEQKLQLHKYDVPRKIEKFLEQNKVGKYFQPQSASENGLEEFLQQTYKKLVTQARGLGINSIMLNTYSAGKEFLLLDGTLASDTNPMKQTFAYHTDRLVKRMGKGSLTKLNPEKQSALLAKEITAELVLKVLASGYGNDIVLDLLFGFRKPIRFFSGHSSQVVYQYLYPSANNPLGLIILSFSYYHSNVFALSRIITAEHFSKQKDMRIPMEIYAINKPLPGLPTFPEAGQRYPFLKELAQRAALTGDLSRWTAYQGKKYYFTTYQSNLLSQFTLAGIVKKSDVDNLINRRTLTFYSILLSFIVLLLVMAVQTAKDYLQPLTEMLNGMQKISKGDYQARILFNREDEFAVLAAAFNKMAQNLSEKDKLASSVSESAVEMASSDEGELQAMKGQKRLVAILYIGIQNYENLVKTASPAQIQKSINQWIDEVSQVVIASGGEIDKVMEGKILATFFADKIQTDFSKQSAKHRHLENALKAAKKLCASKSIAEIKVGAGIHEGIVISGLMGSLSRRDMTVIGDPVNVAARCFSITLQNPETPMIITTEHTVKEMQNLFSFAKLGEFSIKGKQQKIKLYRSTE